jgi:hypothetical protein
MTLRRAEAGTFYVEQNFQILSPKKTIFCHSNLKSYSLTNTFIKIVILSISSINRNRVIELKFHYKLFDTNLNIIHYYSTVTEAEMIDKEYTGQENELCFNEEWNLLKIKKDRMIIFHNNRSTNHQSILY